MQTLFRLSSVIAIAYTTAIRDLQSIAIATGASRVLMLIRSILKHSTVTKILQSLSIVLLSWILAILAMVIYQRRHEQGHALESGSRQGEVVVTEHRTQDVMIVSVGGREYRYHTDQLFPLGTRLWITASIQIDTLPLWREHGDILPPSFITGEMDRAGWLRMRGLHGTITPSNSIRQGYDDLPRHTQTRAWLVKRVSTIFSGQNAALLLGMLIGDRSGFDNVTYQHFIDSGLVHIVAVSGGNLVMIMVFLGLVLIWIPLRVRIPIMAIAVVLYAMVVGMDSSIFRAVVMSLLTMMALLSGRMTNVWRLMGITSLLMLWRNPYFLWHDIGFIFSYAALIGIVLIRPWITKITSQTRHCVWRQRIPVIIWADYILPTMGATFVVMPFLLLFTDSRNLFSLLANIIVLPIVPIVMIGGLVAVILAGWMGQNWIAMIIDLLLNYILRVSDWVSTHGRLLHMEQRRYIGIVLIVISTYGYMTWKKGQKINDTEKPIS